MAKFIIGNWKMYKTAQEAEAFIAALKQEIKGVSARVMLAVPFTALHTASKACQGSPILVGAQNMHDAEEGAFTGEISARMLKEAGAQFVLLGHSERRTLFGESSGFIQRKVRRALEHGLMPVLCVGESEEERARGKTEEVLTHQLRQSLEGLSGEQVSKILVAYEPVWAIGTGKTATPEMADSAHALCLTFLQKTFKAKPPVLYGGSVKPENSRELLQMPHIDGALVGGASLNAATFLQIIRGVSS